MSDIELKPEQYFYLSNGMALKSVKELHDALKNMDDNTYSNHVNGTKNDFASWIRGVFKNQIVYIKNDAKPETHPEVFTPPAKAKYVLELNSNFSEKNGLKEGDFVDVFR